MSDLSAEQEGGPPVPSPKVAWLYKHGGEITALRVDYVMLTADTAKTIWHITFGDGHKQEVAESAELAELLDFYPSYKVPKWRAVASLKEELRKVCEARAAFEKKHDRELAEYRRLQKKFGEST